MRVSKDIVSRQVGSSGDTHMDEEDKKKIVIKAHEIIFAPKRTSPCFQVAKNLPAPARAMAVAVANKIALIAIASRPFWPSDTGAAGAGA